MSIVNSLMDESHGDEAGRENVWTGFMTLVFLIYFDYVSSDCESERKAVRVTPREWQIER